MKSSDKKEVIPTFPKLLSYRRSSFLQLVFIILIFINGNTGINVPIK